MPVGPTASANVTAHLAALADRRGWSGRAAFLEGHRVWTHGEVHDRAERAATVLAGRGVAAGDRVLLALPDGIMWVTTFLAAARLGARGGAGQPGTHHRRPPLHGRGLACRAGRLRARSPGPRRRRSLARHRPAVGPDRPARHTGLGVPGGGAGDGRHPAVPPVHPLRGATRPARTRWTRRR
ncbi:AMP-binding protein [Streptomyces javensis]|uniref:AMP-binding protein n=1 Tax=Streptomyces javensis TaxID=114698 RepID=UPI00340B6DE5